MASILIKNGKVWDGEKFFFADVLTKDNKIEKIEKDILEEAEFVFDAKGKIVLPGLVDIHIHMKNISPDEWGIDTSCACVPFGVTTAADASASVNKGTRELLEKSAVKSKVFVFSNGNDFESVKAGVEKFGEYVAGIKTSVDINAGVKDISQIKSVVEIADKLSLPVVVHSSNPPYSMENLVNTLRKGDIITHAYHGGINNVSDDDFKCIKIAKEKGIVIDAGLAGHIHTDFKVFRDAIERGAIPDVISTDITRYSLFKRGGRYGMTMCMSIAKHLGMTEEEVFRAVTVNPAKTLNMDCGMLEIGKCADIAVLEYTNEGFDLTDKAGNHIVSSEGYRCILTVADGEVVYRG